MKAAPPGAAFFFLARAPAPAARRIALYTARVLPLCRPALVGAWLLAVSPTVPAGGGATRCLTVELTARGRPGHGASVDLHSSTHRLIRALDSLLSLDQRTDWIAEPRIRSLSGSPAINVKAARASAVLDLRVDASRAGEELRAAVRSAVGENAALEVRECPAR